MPEGHERNEEKHFTIRIPEGLSTIAIPIVLLAFGAIAIWSNLATRPWVEEGLAIQRKYTDEKVQSAIDKVIDHSDMNFQRMSNEQRAQGVKLDMVMDIMKAQEMKRK